MSGLLQKADLTMLEEQIQKMQNAYEYAEKTTQIIKKVQKKLRGQDGRRAVQIKNALHEQDERSQELSSDLKNLKDGLVWVENLMYYADQEAARQLGAENDGSWDMKRKAFEEARARLPNEDPVILILNGDESAHDDTTDIPRGDDGASNQRDSGRVADGMRQYENTGYNYQGNDYSDFSVLNGFDPDICCIKQGNINHPANGKLCVSVAQMVLHKIKTGNTTDPTSTWRGGQTQYDYSQKIGDPAVYKDQPSILREIYNQIINNKNPVMVRMARSGDTDNGHTVTVIGIRSGRTGDNLTIDDLLVMDPATGKVCTFREACKASNCKETIVSRANDYALRIPN